jgi:hypothetical protein
MHPLFERRNTMKYLIQILMWVAKITTFDPNQYQNFAFNRRETHLILTAKNGKKKRIRLPKL